MPIARGYWAAAAGSAPSRLFHRSITSLQRRRRKAAARLEPVASLPDSADTLHAGELEIRLGDGLVLASGRALMLSVREFELLVAMARKIGAIVTREELFATVWGSELRAGDRSVDVYVSKLRGKLETAMPDRRFIHTHPGFGYRFQPEAPAETAPRAPVEKIMPVADAAEKQDQLSRDVHIGTPRA
jgi:DNA-binding response OmpR family regulator